MTSGIPVYHDMRDWWTAVQDFAIPAVFSPSLTRLEAAAILAAFESVYRVYFRHLRRSQGDVEEESIWQEAISQLDNENRSQLDELRSTLGALLGELRTGSGFFVRLSSRSPKDCLLKCRAAPGPDSDVAAGYTHPEMMLRALCSSQRIADDVRAQRPPCIVVRPWVSLLGWSEVRVFVYQGKITAVSEYNPRTSEETKNGNDTADSLRCLEKDILDFVLRQIIPAMANHAADGMETGGTDAEGDPTSFIADVGLVSPGTGPNDAQWKLIEINPWGKACGGCLFSWVVDADILFGRAPFEFRVY